MSPILSAPTLTSQHSSPIHESHSVYEVAGIFNETHLCSTIPRSLSAPAYQPPLHLARDLLEPVQYDPFQRKIPIRPSLPPSPSPATAHSGLEARRARGASINAATLPSVGHKGTLWHQTTSHSSAFTVATQLLRGNRDRECEILSGVSYNDFTSLTRFVEKNFNKLLRKPKLTYICGERMLIVEWASGIHEAPTDDFILLFREYENARFSQRDFRVNASTSRTIVTENITAVPDMVVTVSSMKAQIFKYLLIFECAFFQSADNIFAKVKTLVASLPEVQMVFLLQIKERNRFRAPNPSSATWEKFQGDPSPMGIREFLRLVADEAEELQKNDALEQYPEEFMGPVSAGGHVWCNISSVQYHVWVRQDDDTLDINPASMRQNEWSAYGELPTQDDGSDMEHVTEIVNKGLAQVRRAIVDAHHEFCEQFHQIPVDASLFAMPIVLPATWDHFRSALTEAKQHSAFERYLTWYLESFRGEKSALSDFDYVPSEQGDSDKEAQLGPQRRQGPAQRRQLGKRVTRKGNAGRAVGDHATGS